MVHMGIPQKKIWGPHTDLKAVNSRGSHYKDTQKKESQPIETAVYRIGTITGCGKCPRSDDVPTTISAFC